MIDIADGFRLWRGFARDVQLAALIDVIAWEQRTFRMFGRTIAQPRLTAWYGDAAYTYSGQTHTPAPMPAIVGEIQKRIEVELRIASQGIGDAIYFNSVLANYYRDGRDSVAWHADDERELGLEPTIASLSIGASRTFAIRRNADGARFDLQLEHGDLVIMSGRSQLDYQHAVPKVRRSESAGPRVNLTFRAIT